MKKVHLGVIIAGAAVGLAALILTALGNPTNMGFCIACFLRDISGAVGLHSAAKVQYVRPEIIGLVLGAFIMSVASKEFKARAGSSPAIRFVLGAFVVIGALAFLGCPLRMVLRLGGGDLNALVGLIGFTGGILLGKVIGENRLEDAREDAKKLMKLTVISGALGGLLILAATPFVLKYASLSETAMHYLKYMLLINTYYVMGAAVNTTLIAGVFRAGGDSRFGFVCDTIDMWCYAVPLGFIAAFVFKLPVMWVYFLLCTDEFVKWPWVFKHYRSEKWLNNITRDNLFEEKITQE